ncbi:imidazole glycerol phosphate synthase subunit HisH [Treponema sp.]|uniref:imidazole glycerol phosphate synthase subunit HisH n=1 Tax=Treponema sp. TaxID=166 RepID=UPI003890D348
MIGIVDYNAGNITSVEHALEYLKADYVLSKDPAELKNADKIVFPGVGDAAYAMEQLKATGFEKFLKDFHASGKPMIGICLGSQIVFDYSEEGNVECLGLIPGKIRHFSDLLKNNPSKDSFKIPQMGWNDIEICNGGSKLLEGIDAHSDFYFVHSYVIQPEDENVIKGYANYGIKVPSVIEKDNLTVFQFHPEKSGKAGLKILENFVNL